MCSKKQRRRCDRYRRTLRREQDWLAMMRIPRDPNLPLVLKPGGCGQ